ncbi:SphA family protein, partial [Roseateles sp. GG27B]
MNRLNATLGALALALGTAGLAHATEGGGSVYPLGSENFTCCALPPPGLYGIVYGQHYAADEVRGNDGQVVTPSTFKVRATAIAPRLVWITPTQMAGAAVAGVHAILPIVDLKVTIAPGTEQSKSGIGDLVFGPFLAWHHSDSLHTVLGLDFFAPTGQYKLGDLANIGRNYWAVQPVFGVSY